jgi:hypothetical protein
MLCLSYYCLFLLFNKIGEREEQIMSGRDGGEEGDWSRERNG